MNLAFNQDIIQIIWLFLVVISGIFGVVLLYVFIILLCVWFVEKIKNLIDTIKKIYQVIEEFDVDQRKDICRISITVFILTLSTIANFALNLFYYNNSAVNSSFQNLGHVISRTVALYYILVP